MKLFFCLITGTHVPCSPILPQSVKCFCFDEQKIGPGQTVDLPVFFYIDPEMDEDKRQKDVKNLVLNYVFNKIDDDE